MPDSAPDQDKRAWAWDAVHEVIGRLIDLTEDEAVCWRYDGTRPAFILEHRGVEYILDEPQRVGGYVLLIDTVPVWRGHGLYDLVRAIEVTIPGTRPVMRGPEPLDYRAPGVLKKALENLES